jgi:hypothetical protein
MGGVRNIYKTSARIPDHSEVLGEDERIILKWVYILRV